MPRPSSRILWVRILVGSAWCIADPQGFAFVQRATGSWNLSSWPIWLFHCLSSIIYDRTGPSYGNRCRPHSWIAPVMARVLGTGHRLSVFTLPGVRGSALRRTAVRPKQKLENERTLIRGFAHKPIRHGEYYVNSPTGVNIGLTFAQVMCVEDGRQAAFHHVDNGQRLQLTTLIEHPFDFPRYVPCLESEPRRSP